MLVHAGWFFEVVSGSFFNGYPPVTGTRQLWVLYGTWCMYIDTDDTTSNVKFRVRDSNQFRKIKNMKLIGKINM